MLGRGRLLPKGTGCFLLPLGLPQCCPQADWALHTQTQSSQDSSVLAASCGRGMFPTCGYQELREGILGAPKQAVAGGGGPSAHGDPGMTPSLSSCSLTLDGLLAGVGGGGVGSIPSFTMRTNLASSSSPLSVGAP